ncbi:MAG TPA: response regulator transcription factor [Thermoanaerobaculia bacterium]|nr:response regulator transcription factor [Thermoanaerobaculia bacterium]
MRLLVVEDERRLADHLSRGLREEGYAVDHAPTRGRAAELAIENPYDLVILDLRLPDGSGLDLLADWRRDGRTMPVLVLTARDRQEEKVGGLDAGADDYLTKPFDFAELLARVRALLRRRGTPVRDVLTAGDLSLDRTARRAEIAGRAVELTPKEFALLEYFLLHPDAVLSRATIAEHVWDADYEAKSNVIDVMVARLRRKLGGDDGGEPSIESVPGVGYALRLDGASR